MFFFIHTSLEPENIIDFQNSLTITLAKCDYAIGKVKYICSRYLESQWRERMDIS